MPIEWDPLKARSNSRKHGVQFADAVSALEDENGITVRDERGDEERWVTIGMDALARVLVVVYSMAKRRAEADFSPQRNACGMSPIQGGL